MQAGALWPRPSRLGAARRAPQGEERCLNLFRRLAVAAVILALDDTGGFAAPAAQVIELGPAHLAAAHDLDRVDHRRVQRKHALDAFAVRNFAHGEVLVEPRTGAADADALVGLDAAALAFDHLDVDQHGVARLELGNL